MAPNLTSVGCPGADPPAPVGDEVEPPPRRSGRPLGLVLPRARPGARGGGEGPRRGQRGAGRRRRPRGLRGPARGGRPQPGTRHPAGHAGGAGLHRRPLRRPRPRLARHRRAAAGEPVARRRLGPARRRPPDGPDHRLPPVDGGDAALDRAAGPALARGPRRRPSPRPPGAAPSSTAGPRPTRRPGGPGATSPTAGSRSGSPARATRPSTPAASSPATCASRGSRRAACRRSPRSSGGGSTSSSTGRRVPAPRGCSTSGPTDAPTFDSPEARGHLDRCAGDGPTR